MARRIVVANPGDNNGPFHMARALRALKRSDEADAMLGDAPSRWPNDDTILSIWATLPMQYGRNEDALARFDLLVERFPKSPALPKFLDFRNRLRLASGDDSEGVR